MVALNYAKVVLQEEGNTGLPTVLKLAKLFENGHAWDELQLLFSSAKNLQVNLDPE